MGAFRETGLSPNCWLGSGSAPSLQVVRRYGSDLPGLPSLPWSVVSNSNILFKSGLSP